MNEIGAYKQINVLRYGEHAKAHENFQDESRKADICSLCLKEVSDQADLISYFIEREKVDPKSLQVYESKTRNRNGS